MRGLITKLGAASSDFTRFFPHPRLWLLIFLLLVFLSKPSVIFDIGIKIEALTAILSSILINVLSFLSAYVMIRKTSSINHDVNSSNRTSILGVGKVGAVVFLAVLYTLLPALSVRQLPLLSAFLSLFIPIVFVLFSREDVFIFEKFIKGFFRLLQNFLPVAVAFIIYQHVSQAVFLLIGSVRPLETNLTYPKSFTGLVLDIVELGINQLALIWLCVFFYHLSLPKFPEPEPASDT